MELRDYWRTIRRRWKVVVVCILLTVGAAGLLTWQTTPQYASSAQIFVSTSSADVGDASVGGQFATQRVASYADLVDTRKLAERVAGDLGGDRYSAERVRSAIKAVVVPDTVNLVITATDPDPVMARDVAQAYAEALSDLVAEIETPEGKDVAPIRASVVDDADISDSPVSPQPMRNIGLGLVLGVLLGVGLAVLRELLDTTVTSADDVAEVTEHADLGAHSARRTSGRATGRRCPVRADPVGGVVPRAAHQHAVRRRRPRSSRVRGVELTPRRRQVDHRGQPRRDARHGWAERRADRVRPAPSADRRPAGSRQRCGHHERLDRQGPARRGAAGVRLDRVAGADVRAPPAQPF